MIKRFGKVLLCICIGLLLGTYSAYYVLKHFHNFKNYTRDGWYSNSPSLKDLENPYILAQHALQHYIYLETNDDIIFKANKDERGEKLKAPCIYKITNLHLPASFYSLYTTDKAGINYPKLIKAKNPKLASLPFELNSQYLLKYYAPNLNEIILAPAASPQAGNWLTTPDYGNFSLILTMHNLKFLRTQNSSFPLPKIHKISCSALP